MLGSAPVPPAHYALRMQEVHIVVQVHAIAAGIAVHVGHRGSLRGQRRRHNMLTSLCDKVIARIVLNVLIVRLYFPCVHVAEQRL